MTAYDDFVAQQGDTSAIDNQSTDFDKFLKVQAQPTTHNATAYDEFIKQPANSSILDTPTQITQNFGTYNPIEPTANHISGDTNFSANMGDPVKVPQGNWTVVKAYNQANPQGAPGDYADNSGWGNDVWLKDQNGQMLHFLHLSGVNVTPGQTIPGGSLVGQTGSSGNATGTNLGVEYYDASGNLSDFMQSPYAQSISVTSQGVGGQGGGFGDDQSAPEIIAKIKGEAPTLKKPSGLPPINAQ